MNCELKLGEHGLAEECGADQLQASAQEIEFLRFARRMGHHVIVQQQFVGDGGRFRNEGRIIGGFKRLRLVRQQRMHGMPPLMHERGERFVIIVIVEQQIGVHVIGRAIHIGAIGLARMGKQVHPAARKPLIQKRGIFGAVDRRHFACDTL